MGLLSGTLKPAGLAMSSGVRMAVAFTLWLVLPAAIGIFWDKPAAISTHDAIVQLENRWLQAEDDPEVLQSILADDFIHVLPVGFITKEEQIRYLRSRQPNRKGKTKHFEDLRVRVFGTAAIANGIVVASENGKIDKTVFTDVFAYRHGEWQAVNAQETPLGDSPK